MNEKNLIGDLIFFLSKELKTITEAKLKKYSIGMGQLQLLMVFYSKEDCAMTQSELVKLLKVDKGNVSRNVNKLLNKRYIMNSADHINHLKLTQEGKELKNELIMTFQDINHTLLLNISDELLLSTYKAMSLMKQNLED